MIQMIIDVTQPMVFMGKCMKSIGFFLYVKRQKIVEGLADKNINKG